MTVRVLLVDDQPLFREGLRAVISGDPTLQVIGEASNGEQALALCETHRPDVVLMDLRMPLMDGVMATRRLAMQRPECRIVVLTTFDDDASVFEALRAGAVGYLLKDAAADRLREAVHAAARGDSFLHPSVAAKVLAELSRLRRSPREVSAKVTLTDRERDVLTLIVRGASNKEIASTLFLAEGTVKNHLTSVFDKLEVSDRTQAAIRARELGLA